MTRRSFIGCAGTLAATLTLAGPSVLQAASRTRYRMGLQLYTVRDPMAKDPAATLSRVAQIGYQDLETFGFDAQQVGYYGFEARRFKQVLDERGLTSTSGHYDLFRYLNTPLSELTEYVDRCIEGALALDQKYITWPWLDPESRTIDHFKKLAGRLNIIGERIRKAGLGLAYHNHEFEFIDHNGETGWEILIRDTDPQLVKLQLDLFWSTHSSPLSAEELFKQQPGRFVMWHIKDMNKHDKDKYTELGNGRIDYTKIMPYAELAGLKYYYVEQGDDFAVDPMTSIATSAAYVKERLAMR